MDLRQAVIWAGEEIGQCRVEPLPGGGYGVACAGWVPDQYDALGATWRELSYRLMAGTAHVALIEVNEEKDAIALKAAEAEAQIVAAAQKESTARQKRSEAARREPLVPLDVVADAMGMARGYLDSRKRNVTALARQILARAYDDGRPIPPELWVGERRYCITESTMKALVRKLKSSKG
jgi:hypothetical protein